MDIDRYKPAEIEKKWLKVWETRKTFEADLERAKKPFYNLMMFPYPSGEGLHVGHVYAFGGSDTFGRFKRLQGHDVFEPIGFDSFGIHSENYAISKKIHPQKLIEQTTRYFREKQLARLGALFDWSHQVITSDTDYYRWTQWVFVQLFKAGLVVRKKAPVDWCPSCKTVLADEQVISGRCERCSTQVIQKELEQWFFKITNYAEKLLKNLDRIDWSDTTKTMQKNWIGRSEGAEIDFPIKSSNSKLRVFTTRPDTIFGATFMVIAPEHPLAVKIPSAKYFEATRKYIEESKKVSEIERAQGKSGVFTGSYCLNPFTKEQIPVWVADYVLMGYGTGAIMGVPAHDIRDYEFAKKYKLPIVEVISGGDVKKEAYIGEGKLVNSGQFSGVPSLEAIGKISNYIEKNRLGRKAVNYHLRDWLISRQRYWGPPIPMIFCQICEKKGQGEKVSGKVVAPGWYSVPEVDLPVKLPYLKDYRPKDKDVSPLAALPDFVRAKCPGCGNNARRETDVSDTFLDSSWYFLRYPSTKFGDRAISKELTKKWLPVDMYIGGNEHAVLHLLYTRFVTMALHDIGLIDFEEPFKKFRAHGLIIRGGAKMSKSRGNVVNPNEYIDAYGSDTLRMYLLFIGPYELGGDFSDRAIAGVYRFLNRAWKIVLEISDSPAKETSDRAAKEINKLVKKVSEDTQALKFNTAIAAIMEFSNFTAKHKKEIDLETIRKFLIVLCIFAPFTAEELWSRVVASGSVHDQSWPKVEEGLLKEERLTIPVQINGKLRGTLQINAGEEVSANDLLQMAKEDPRISKHLGGKQIGKKIYVPDKILNVVTKS